MTAVLDASRIAVTTHREEKLGLLKSLLIRVAVDSDSDELFALQMLRFVDALDPEHLLVLEYCADPSGWFDAKGMDRSHRYQSSPRRLMYGAQLPVAGESLQIVLRGLSERGLVNLDGFGVDAIGDSMWRPLATELGQSLLEFVAKQMT